VKRARICFTGTTSRSISVDGSGNRAVFRRRSLALRPRLASGLPWTASPLERTSLVETTLPPTVPVSHTPVVPV
jgi:hypothetical protein